MIIQRYSQHEHLRQFNGAERQSKAFTLTGYIMRPKSSFKDVFLVLSKSMCCCIVLYSSIYIAPLNSRGPTEALLVRLAPRKETGFKK